MAWVAIYRQYKFNSQLYFKRYNISKSQQLVRLFQLSFGYNIPPSEYYSMCLHRYPSNQWLDFIYDFQAQIWHQTFALGASANEAQKTLTNKFSLEKLLKQNGISSVSTLMNIRIGESLDERHIKALPNKVFCKPIDGNRSVGCFTLEQTDNKSFTIINVNNGHTYSSVNLEQINQRISKHDYLIQEMLLNHSDFNTLFSVSQCTVLRIVTCALGKEIKPVSAFTDIPLKAKPSLYWSIQVDIHSARLKRPTAETIKNDLFDTFFDTIKNHRCPQFKAMIDICLNAHHLLKELPTIAWDVALTEKGPTIIEGNCGWGNGPQQAIHDAPTLRGPLGDFYLKYLKSSTLN